MLARGPGWLAVDKAPGLLVHNAAWAGPKEVTLTELVRQHHDAAAVPLHRLDRGTSGVCLFATDRSAVASLQAAHEAHPKHYLAIVRGHLRVPVIDVDHAIVDDGDGRARPKGTDIISRPARSRLAAVAASPVDRLSLVAITLLTGRRHQARRHCKHVSHPIIGDATHGKGPLNRACAARYGLRRLCLHAWRVAVGAEGILVEAPLPTDWDLATLFPDLPSSDLVERAAAALRV